MNYLFFDTECANCQGGEGKLCEFGYLLTDESFNIIEKDNLLINPLSPFDSYGHKRAGIVFSHQKSEYLASPSFSERYKKIAKLLSDKNNLVVGFSTECDARYILSEISRFKLKGFNYKFLDVQKLFKLVLNRETSLHLKELFDCYCGENKDVFQHEALFDAIMTMEVFKAFLAKIGKSSIEFSVCPEAFGEVFCGRVVTGGRLFKTVLGNRLTTANRKAFDNFIFSKKPLRQIKGIAGKTFSFEKEFEKEHFKEALAVADAIIENGGRYVRGIAPSYLIVDEKNDKIKVKSGTKLLTLAELQEFFVSKGINVDLDKTPIHAILGKLPENTAWYQKYLAEHQL